MRQSARQSRCLNRRYTFSQLVFRSEIAVVHAIRRIRVFGFARYRETCVRRRNGESKLDCRRMWSIFGLEGAYAVNRYCSMNRRCEGGEDEFNDAAANAQPLHSCRSEAAVSEWQICFRSRTLCTLSIGLHNFVMELIEVCIVMPYSTTTS